MLQDHQGQVPGDRETLMNLPGVGRKTANLVLGMIYGIPCLVVDTHVIRLSGRFGLTNSTEPYQIEKDLMEILPKEDWIDYGHLIIAHGRKICTARKPFCKICPVGAICPKGKVSLRVVVAT
jgi:endonuclease-3